MRLFLKDFIASPTSVVSVSLVLVGFVGAMDYLTGPLLGVAIFHLLPIFLITWSLGRKAGLGLAILAALVWLMIDLMEAQRIPYPYQWMTYWNALTRLAFFVLFVLLLSALKESYQRVLEVNRLAALGQMMASLAHEGRGILQGIQISQELLAMELENRPELENRLELESRTENLKNVAAIQEGVDRLRRLYEEIRGFSTPPRLEKERCDLGELVRETWTKVVTPREVHFQSDAGKLDSHVEADIFALEGVFRNIFSNAIQACRDPVEIKVLWSEAEIDGKPAVRIAVRDNGPGITAESRESIFQPFHSTKRHGTGLGLAIVRRAVEAHGGRIAVGEHTPGAEFVILLPRKTPEAAG